MGLTKEQIQIEISVRKNVVVEYEKQIAEFEKQLEELKPELVPCRWCGKTPYFGRQGPLALRCDKTCELFYDEKSQARAWNEMHDTRPARIVEKDGDKFIEFRALVRIGNDSGYKKGTYWMSESGNLFRNGLAVWYLINNSKDLKIEVK